MWESFWLCGDGVVCGGVVVVEGECEVVSEVVDGVWGGKWGVVDGDGGVGWGVGGDGCGVCGECFWVDGGVRVVFGEVDGFVADGDCGWWCGWGGAGGEGEGGCGEDGGDVGVFHGVFSFLCCVVGFPLDNWNASIAHMSAVDIIIPALNAEKVLPRTLDSVVTQTYDSWRCVVVDDGSVDGTAEIVEDYAREHGERFVCMQNDTNMGVAHSLNVGIGYCLTHKPADFMARIDAGDVMVPQRLKTQVALMQSNPDIDVCGSNMTVVALDGSRRVTRLPETDVDIRTSIPFLNPMAHPTVMMRMNIFDAFAYNGMFYASEDYALWAQLVGCEAVFHNIVEPLVEYYVSADSETALKVGSVRWRESVVGIMQQYFNDAGLGHLHAARWVEFYVSKRRTEYTHYCYQVLLENHERLGLNPQLLYRLYYGV